MFVCGEEGKKARKSGRSPIRTSGVNFVVWEREKKGREIEMNRTLSQYVKLTIPNTTRQLKHSGTGFLK